MNSFHLAGRAVPGMMPGLSAKTGASGVTRPAGSCQRILIGFLLFLGLTVHAGTPLPEATKLWKFSLAASFPYNSSQSTPAIAPDGTVYQATFDGTLFALTPIGKEKWRFKAGREIKSSPAIADDGTIYFGSRDRKFYALTPAGKLKWQFATGAWVDSSPAIAKDGTIYFGSWDKNFYALNSDGSLKWKLAVGTMVDSSPAIAADGTIYFGAHDRKLYALDAGGKVRWTCLTGGEIISSPAIGADGRVYFTSLDGNLYALNPDGTERWHYHSGSTTESSPVLDEEGDVCIGNNVSTLVVSSDGKLRWSYGSAVPMEVSPAVVAGRFYFSAPWWTLRAMWSEAAPSVERQIWKTDLSLNISASLVVGDDGTVYACAERFLYAIQPPGALVPPAKSPWPMFRANARHTGRVGNW